MKIPGILAGLSLLLIAVTANAHIEGKRPSKNNCRSAVEGFGVAAKLDKAKKRARQSWRRKATRKHGWDFRVWKYSNGKHYHCRKKLGTHRCYAGAYPCEVKEAEVPSEKSRRAKFALKLKKIKIYTIPSKPTCNKPFRVVGEFWTNKPGTVKFKYYRNDGQNHKAFVKTGKVNGGYAKRWSKKYQFSKSIARKYKIVALGHPKATNWLPVIVKCGAKNDYKHPGNIRN